MWFLREDVALELRQFRAQAKLTADQQAEFAAKVAGGPAAGPRNLTLAGDVAEIAVEGVLTERLDIFAWLFGLGNTTYRDIREALATADADPTVKRIVLNINSPGGQVRGLFETLAAIESTSKPISVRASLATSAAYAIAAAAGKIEASTRASEFGSIGVVVTMLHAEELIEITSTAAPKKRPDPTTEEGKAVIREYLDALHDQFVESIARGRGVTASTVNAEFGQGAVLLADEAKKRGMIDRLPGRVRGGGGARSGEGQPPAAQDPVPRCTPTEFSPGPSPAETAPAASGGAEPTPPRRKHMDINTLKAQHPELYAAVLAEGEKAGVEKERDRVTAHLIRGQSNDAMDLAIDAVDKGTAMTETMRAKYDARGRNRDDQAARQAETDAAAETTAGADTDEPESRDLGDEVVAILEKKRGKKD